MTTHAHPDHAPHGVDQRRVITPPLVAAAAVGLGLAIGVVTFLAGGHHLSPVGLALDNSVSAWLVAPWAVGLLCRRGHAAATAGMACCLLQLVGYDGCAHLTGHAVPVRHDLIWAGFAVVGGPVFAMAAHLWRYGPRSLRGLGPATLASSFLAEVLVDYDHEFAASGPALLWLTVAAVVCLGGLRGVRQWWWLAVTVPVATAIMHTLTRVAL